MDFGASASYEESGMEANIDIAMGMDLELRATLDPAATQMKGTLSFSYDGAGYGDGRGVLYRGRGTGREFPTRTAETDGSAPYRRDAEQEDFLNENIYDSIAGGQAEAVLEEEEAMVNGQAAYVISSELSGSDLEDFMSESFSGTDEMMGEDSVDWGEGAAQIKIFIYKESRLPARVQVDCRDFGRALMEASVGNTPGVNIEISAFDMSLFFDEYNSVEAIQVPEEARSGASEENEETDSESIPGRAGGQRPGGRRGRRGYLRGGDRGRGTGAQRGRQLYDSDRRAYRGYHLNGRTGILLRQRGGRIFFQYGGGYQRRGGLLLHLPAERLLYSGGRGRRVHRLLLDGRLPGVQQCRPAAKSSRWTWTAERYTWAQVDYVYDSGYGASNIRNLHAWTEVGDILFTVELNNSSYEENVMPTGSQELLAEAIRRVVLK